MTDGTSQGLFIVVAIVIFGIFTLMVYILFEDTLSPALANMFTDALDKSTQSLENDYTGDNLLRNGYRLVEGPVTGYSGTTAIGKKEGIEGREFIEQEDLSPIFDRFGVGTYTISFDLKASMSGRVLMYTHDGSTKYHISHNIEVMDSDKWERYSAVVNVSALDVNHPSYSEDSKISFWGTYGTGISPSVKNIKVELGSVLGIPEYVDTPNYLRY